MRLCSLYRVELRRLALSKFTWGVALLSLLAPLLGCSLYPQADAEVMSGRYIANPALAGAFIGALLWAVLALLEADRVHRAKADVLVDTVVSPIRMSLVRTLALMTLSALTSLACVLIYLPYTMVKMDYLFGFDLYFASYIILMLFTCWISIFIATALYQITNRIELAGILYAACAYFSLSGFANASFFARWLNPLVLTYSDAFSSSYYLQIALYTRITWLALAGGVWVLSLLCIRRYQKNLFASFWRGLNKFYIPAASLMLICAAALLWVNQPFVDHGPVEFTFNGEENQITASSSKATYRLTAKTSSGKLHGIAEYTVTKDNTDTDSIGLNPGYKILSIKCDGVDINYKALPDIIADEQTTAFTIPKSDNSQELVIEYEGRPTMLRCFAPSSWGNEVTEEYVSLSNAGTVPKASFMLPELGVLELTLPQKMTPIVNHTLAKNFTENGDGTKTWTVTGAPWRFSWITACDYTVEPIIAANMPVDFIYSKIHEKSMKQYGITEALTDVLDYCTEHLGQLRWSGGSSLMLLERSAIMGGGNAGRGWVEWGESVFTANNLNDPLKGANAYEIFVHEMVHLWWGGLGVQCGENEYDVTSDDPWTSEGPTVYYTYRLVRDKYGEQYAKLHYTDVWQTAVDNQNRSFYSRHPEYLDRLPEQYRAQLNMKAQSTNRYCRMPLMLLKAEQLVGGAEKLDVILQQVQADYAGNGRIFNYQDFLDTCGLKAEDLELE